MEEHSCFYPKTRNYRNFSRFLWVKLEKQEIFKKKKTTAKVVSPSHLPTELPTSERCLKSVTVITTIHFSRCARNSGDFLKVRRGRFLDLLDPHHPRKGRRPRSERTTARTTVSGGDVERAGGRLVCVCVQYVCVRVRYYYYIHSWRRAIKAVGLERRDNSCGGCAFYVVVMIIIGCTRSTHELYARFPAGGYVVT